MASVERFIESTNTASSAEEISSLFGKFLAEYGYDRFCYSLITDHNSIDMQAGHGLMRNYPESWMKHYVCASYVGKDPVPLYCFQTNKPFTWKHVTQRTPISRLQKRIMDEAEEAKLLDGLAVPIHGMSGELAGVGMASSSGAAYNDPNTIAKIRALCFQFHLSYTDMLYTEEKTNNCITLTDREREILLWAAEGKSDAVIADILGVSYSTVRFHLNNAYKKLDSNERIFAVTKAIRLGLIIPSTVSENI